MFRGLNKLAGELSTNSSFKITLQSKFIKDDIDANLTAIDWIENIENVYDDYDRS